LLVDKDEYVMKILLIQPPWSKATAGEFEKFQTKFVFYPPLGLMALAAFIDKNGHSSEIIDLETEFLNIDELCSRIKESKVDIIGLTSSTPTFHITAAYAKILKEKVSLPLVIGGVHVTALKEKAFLPMFDFAISNEGEFPLLELMNELSSSKPDFSNIKGLIYRDKDKVKVNGSRPFISDLDSLPFPARHKLDCTKYIFEVPTKGFVPVTSLALTRGCPFQCVFCSEPMNTGKKLRTRSADSVINEILHVKNEFGITHFYMIDSTLTVNRKLVEEFCNKLIAIDANITFEGQTRVNLVDEPLLSLMKKAGLVRLSFGVESSDRQVLALMKKQIDPESMRKAFKLCKKLNISTLCGGMIGNPGDTKETVLATARFIRSIPEVRYAPLPIAIPYPGTELYDMATKGLHGLKLVINDYSKFNRYAGGVMEIDGMIPAELVRLQRKALIIMHLSFPKMLGIVQHFGLFNVLFTFCKMVEYEFRRLLGISLPGQADDENAVLKRLGLISKDNQ
jgi:anaerobic magnesium-protoporphyrin IX monomethyl ester cyclase